jgi:hypothetical protein
MKLTSLVLLAILPAVLGFGQPQAKPEAGGKTEGIKVHGHWVLEIKNPDGSLASRKEFENSLAAGTGNGAALIAPLLVGGATVGPWVVAIFSSGTSGPFLSVTQTAVGCVAANNPCSSSLNVSSAAGQIVFQGSTPAATAAGPITSVSTAVSTCASNMSPQACLAQPFFPGLAILTSAPVTGMNIQVGQAIIATVTISFS